MASIHSKLAEVQQLVKCPKAQFNSFGGYKFRNLEDINAALKPICAEVGCMYFFSDSIEPMECGGEVRWYLKATVEFAAEDCEHVIDVTAYAREAVIKKGMDDAQLTGLASSYARKYAACGLFAIDGGEEVDAMDNRPTPPTESQERELGELAAELAELRGKTVPEVMDAVRGSKALKSVDTTKWSYNTMATAINILNGWLTKAKEA